MKNNISSRLSHGHRPPVVERRYLVPFVLVTCLFALWGFANDITNPMVAAFQTVMELSATKASMVQFAFYGGYATMAAYQPRCSYASSATRAAFCSVWLSLCHGRFHVYSGCRP